MSHALREAFLAFRRAPLLTGLSAVMMSVSLFVIGLYGMAAHNISVVLERIESRVEIVAYLRDDAPPEQVRAAQQQLHGLPQVKEVLYVSREQALEVAKRELQEVRSLLTELGTNPLPASLEIRMRPGYRDPQTVQAIATRVRGLEFVEEVQYGHDWLEKVHLLRKVAAAAALVVGGAFAVVAALIIGAAVRLAVFARRNEILIMRLVGATDGFIRAPFLLEGLITGILGGLIALGATFLTYRVLTDSVVPMVWLPDLWIVGALIASGIVGLLASGISVRRHLREL